MILIHDAAQLVTPLANGNFSVIENGAIVSEKGIILFAGSTKEALSSYSNLEKIDATGKVLMPGFVDPHTHLIFGGNRCHEFLMRLRGATYQEVAAAGGGIQHTVRATRDTPEEILLEDSLRNLETMLQYGTTTAEVKSGYGLSWESERKLLTVARRVSSQCIQDIVITFLGAHDFPPEKKREEYIQEILTQMLPAVADEELATFCDVFCDRGYYSVEEARKISLKAKSLGLKIKLHADELADVNGAALAAELNAVSADHLILANEEGIAKMAEARVIAVLLPGTSFALKVKQHAPARRMIEAGVRVALATDFNPGTCFSHSMQYVLQLASLLYGLSPEEVLTAATLHAAAAVDMEDKVGSLEPGKQMDCLIFDIPHYGYLFYNLGVNRLETVIKKGEIAWNRNRN
jgi:imidazolonepropionase